jgi:SWI/SNF-related matrix-associated actin-dependent regulator 1 of chromatin subfamily A
VRKNPHNDKQAEDRAWRMGQTRDVTVIRLIVKDTIEEDMFSLATTKLTLDSEVSKIEDDASRQASGTATPVEGEISEDRVDVQVEKKAKQSILRSLRAKLEASQSGAPPSNGDLPPNHTAYLQTPADGPAVGAQIKEEGKEDPM